MSESDIEDTWDSVDPQKIADELKDGMYGLIDAEEARVAGENISLHRIPIFMEAMKDTLALREAQLAELDTIIRDQDVIFLEDLIQDDDEYKGGLDYLREAIEQTGQFVGYTDFVNVARHIHNSRGNSLEVEKIITNVFRTLVLFFLEDNSKLERALEGLRNSPSSFYSRHTMDYRYFLKTEMLIPYASYRVEPEFKIPGVGKVGRRVMRAVIFDEDDIEEKLAEERARFD